MIARKMPRGRSSTSSLAAIDGCSVIHVKKLPEGWLGKPNALQAAYSRSSGEWIVFTDADVRFAPDLLRRTMALAQHENWDHMTLLAALELRGFWEVTTVGYLGLGFALGFQPWKVSDPKSDTYFGVGAFQLVRRSAYQAIGTHRRLAMEVVDDIKLGKLIKLGGFRSGLSTSQHFVQIRWHDGFVNLVRGLMKNLFAGYGYSVCTRSAFNRCGIYFQHPSVHCDLVYLGSRPSILRRDLHGCGPDRRALRSRDQ